MVSLSGFVAQRLQVNGVGIRTLVSGSGPPLLLLHGYPQSHVIWHRVAPALASHFTVVATDLRGYGSSDKPHGPPDHSAYSKRAMAFDQVEVMRQLGFPRFGLCGHDRGARVGHRMAIDHPDAVMKLMLLDVSPTLSMYEQTSMAFARSYWWWFWLIQPAPFPESMVAAAPQIFLQKKIGWGHAGLTPFTDEAYAAYLSYVSDPATMHAMCEDYRAAASIDLDHDRADRSAGRTIACPVRVLWGEFGTVHQCFRPLEDWQRVASDVTGRSVPCGHYLPEEVPELLVEEITQFFAQPTP
jgi:haloacetate dehalogenase